MASSPALLVLAAGMGSRYGGLKQMDPMGPNGELLIEYSIYDALRAGFRRLVFVVRPEIESDFREIVTSRFAGRAEIAFVHQVLSDVPVGFEVPAERRKPWGTGHAILAAREAIDGPFGVINGDDYYGLEAYRRLAAYFEGAPVGELDEYAMVAYRLRNTLSDHGSVARGICKVGADGSLREVVERTSITRQDDGAEFEDEQGRHRLTGEELVSLNFWGFQPSIFTHLQRQFEAFLEARGGELKSEFFIPTVVDRLIRERLARVSVLESGDNWFGVTYAQDKAVVTGSLRELIDRGVYPPALWG